jgi:hypothetical protein
VISSELPVDKPGTYQIDLVGHDGGNPNGQFAFSLNAIELYSGWVEPRILLNKAQRWSKEAVQSIRIASPIPLQGLHSDNDSAFLNEPLQSWCASQGIPYARGRPYHSNDTCYVEQKNFNIVRQAVGYARYETEEEVALIAKLYDNLRLLINFFYPSMKLLEKKRVNGRIRKRYVSRPRLPSSHRAHGPDAVRLNRGGIQIWPGCRKRVGGPLRACFPSQRRRIEAHGSQTRSR